MSTLPSIARRPPLLLWLLAALSTTGCADAHGHPCDEGGCASDLLVLEREAEHASGEALLREVGADGTLGASIRIELEAGERAMHYEQGPSPDVGLLWVRASAGDGLDPDLVELSTRGRVDVRAEAEGLTAACGADSSLDRFYFDVDGRGGVFSCGTQASDGVAGKALVHVDLDAPSWVVEGLAGDVTLTTEDDRALLRVCLSDSCGSESEWRWVDLEDGEMRAAAGLEWFDEPAFWDGTRAGIWLAPWDSDRPTVLQLVHSDGTRESGPELPHGTRLIALSPDGASLVTMLPTWDRSGSTLEDVDELTIWSMAGARWASANVELTCTRPFRAPWGPPRVAWAPNGDAFTVSCGGEAWLVETRGARAIPIASDSIHRTTWTNDGNSFLLERLPSGFSLLDLDARGGVPPSTSWVDSMDARSVQLRHSPHRRACGSLASC